MTYNDDLVLCRRSGVAHSVMHYRCNAMFVATSLSTSRLSAILGDQHGAGIGSYCSSPIGR